MRVRDIQVPEMGAIARACLLLRASGMLPDPDDLEPLTERILGCAIAVPVSKTRQLLGGSFVELQCAAA